LPRAGHRALNRHEKLIGVERLGHVFVGPALSGAAANVILVQRGEHDDWHRSRATISAQSATDFKAIEIREHYVEDNECRLARGNFPERIVTAHDAPTGKSRKLDVSADELVDFRIVLYDEDISRVGVAVIRFS
jgi:hypothetical protein